MLVGPEVVKPLDHSLLQVLPNLLKRIFSGILFEAYLAEAHVLLDRVHLVPELRSRGVHVGDHGPDVADDGGKDEHADEEVDGDEEVLEISFWLWSLTDGGEGEGGPVEAVDEDVD